MPDINKKYWLSVIFTFNLYALTHGFPSLEIKRVYEYNTYGFCPHCGKTYNAGVPASIAVDKPSAKVYRSVRNKKIFGICGGISEYTGLSDTLVRIVMVLYAISIVPGIIYLLLGLTNVMPENPKQLQEMYNNPNNMMPPPTGMTPPQNNMMQPPTGMNPQQNNMMNPNGVNNQSSINIQKNVSSTGNNMNNTNNYN